MQDEIKRNEDGTFAVGQSGNPEGINGKRRTGQPWEIRVAFLEGKYDTVGKVLDLFERDPQTGSMVPSKELRDMNPIDAGIIMGFLGQIVGENKLAERESFWNRKEGRPKETVRHEGGITYGLDERLLGVVRDLRRIKSGRGAETTQLVIDSAPQPNHA